MTMGRPVSRDLTEEGHVQLVGEPLAAARPEDFGALAAVRADEIAHVLDHAQHRDADPLEHLGAPEGVAHRHFLRRGDDDRPAQVNALHQRQLGVARARRQVYEEVVQLTPLHVPQELLDHLHDDGAAPDRRRVALDDEAQRHELHPVALERLHLAAPHRGLPVHAHHARDVRPVDVGIHEANAAALEGERGGEVHRNAGLAHTALAGGDGEHLAEVRQFDRRRRRGNGGAGGEPGAGACASRRSAPARHGDLHARDPGDRLDRFARVTRQGARVLGGEQEGERHLSPVVHGEVLDHAGGDDVLGDAGVLDSREGALDAGAQRVGRGHARECTRAEAGGSTRVRKRVAATEML